MRNCASWQTQLKVTNVVSLNEFEETGFGASD